MTHQEDAGIFDDRVLQMKRKKAVIFDLDGVIIDSEPLHERASRMAFAHYDVPFDEGIFSLFKGKTDRDVVTFVLQQQGAASPDVEEVLEMKRQSYASLIGELRPIYGVIAFLRQIESRFRLALTTSASRRNQELAFRKFELDDFFEVVITSNDITKPKPDPEPYLVTMDRLALRPADCIVIEDSTNGVRSAVAAGCLVIGITTSFDEAALSDAGAHVVVDSYERLAEWL